MNKNKQLSKNNNLKQQQLAQALFHPPFFSASN